jgi:hypothetical protein
MYLSSHLLTRTKCINALGAHVQERAVERATRVSIPVPNAQKSSPLPVSVNGRGFGPVLYRRNDSSYCNNVSSSGFKLTRKSRHTSKLSQLEAMLGATLRRLGTMPLYSPLMPSCVTMTRTASVRDLY